MHTSLCSWTTCLVHTGKVRIKMSIRFVDVSFFLYTIYILQSTFLSFMYTFRRCSFFSVHHLYPAIDIFIFYVYVSLTCIFSVHHLYLVVDIIIFYVNVSSRFLCFCTLFIFCSRRFYLYVYFPLTFLFFCSPFIFCSRRFYLLCLRFVEVSGIFWSCRYPV